MLGVILQHCYNADLSGPRMTLTGPTEPAGPGWRTLSLIQTRESQGCRR